MLLIHGFIFWLCKTLYDNLHLLVSVVFNYVIFLIGQKTSVKAGVEISIGRGARRDNPLEDADLLRSGHGHDHGPLKYKYLLCCLILFVL